MKKADEIAHKVKALREGCIERNRRQDRILAIREGRWQEVAPGLFPEDWAEPVVSNMIDVAAKDFMDNVGPLPQFECKSANMSSDAAKKFADKRTAVAKYYGDCSNLQAQNYGGVDRLMSYGFCVYMVEPDFDESMPKIHVDDNYRAYYQLDRWGKQTLCYARVFKQKLSELIRWYPDAEGQLRMLGLTDYHGRDRWVEVARYYDHEQQCLVVLDGGILLNRIPNVISRCPIRVVEMPKLGQELRGQYDDVIPVQIARSLMQILLLEATEKSVYAPMVVPDDVQDLTIGPDQVVRTQTPQGVQKVALPIPNGLFAEAQNLLNEQRIGSRYPEGRSGSIDASIITGQGVEALMGTFSTAVKTAQVMLAQGLRDVISMCFEMDEALWPDVRKTVTGDDFGSPYEITYKPSKDIAGDYTVKVTYGLTAGMDPNRALIFVLQSLSGGLISRRTAQEELPVDININQEDIQMDLEAGRQSLAAAIATLPQAIPMMATQGGDPSQVVMQIAKWLELRQKGESPEKAASMVFAPPPPPEEAPADPMASLAAVSQSQPQAGGVPPQGGGGGAQDLLMSLAGITQGGEPNLQTNVSRREPI